MSERLECSPSYLAKTFGALVRAGILRSVRGVHGGVLLARRPDQISLLSIVEAMQGLLTGSYCRPSTDIKTGTCAYHQVMEKIHQDTISTLSKWTLAALLRCPTPETTDKRAASCKMHFIGCEDYEPARAKRARAS